MVKKTNIALLCGGVSSECGVSVNSSLNVIKYVDREKFNPYLVFVGEKYWYVLLYEGTNSYPLDLSAADVLNSIPKMNVNLFDKSIEDVKYILEPKVLNQTNFSFSVAKENSVVADKEIILDKALVMIHGTPGENGLVQGYLELKGIPYFSCSSYVSAITFDKHSCKRFLDFAGVKMARDIFIRKEVAFSKREIIRQIGLPMFIKPTVGGSSFGVSKVKKEEEIDKAIEAAFEECPMILAEEAISGREFTCGLYSLNGNIVKLPVTEIVTKREFFDYEAKYLGESDEICPAPISLSLSTKIQNLSEHIYNYMGCSGIVRIDYIVTPNEDIYFLEVNTIPGMTQMSLVPKMLATAKIDLKELISNFLESC